MFFGVVLFGKWRRFVDLGMLVRDHATWETLGIDWGGSGGSIVLSGRKRVSGGR